MCTAPNIYHTQSTYMTPPPCTQESTINQGSYLVWCSDQILIAVWNQRLDMRIIIIIFKYKPIENAQSNGVDRTQIMRLIICVNNPFKSIVQLLLLLIRRRERLWSNILLWVGSAFELYEWLENLGTVPLQMRSHISSRKLYDLLYKPLHCIHTHTHTHHGMLKTQSSLVEHRTFAILILKTTFFSWRTIYSITNSGASPCVFTSARVCVESLWTLRYSFQLSTKFRRKGKGNLERERERERRGKALPRSGRKAPDRQKYRRLRSQTLSISERSLSFTLTLIVPSILRNFQWSPTIFQTWHASELIPAPDMWRRDRDSFAGWFFSSKFGKWSHCAWEGSCARVCVCVCVCVSLALPSLRHPEQDICPEKIRHQNNSVSFLCTCFCLEIFTERLPAL